MKHLLLLFICIITICSSSLLATAQPVESEAPVLPPTNVTIPADTTLKTKLLNEINSTTSQSGDKVTFQLIANYIIDDQVALPTGSKFSGKIVEIVKTSLLNDTYDLFVEITDLYIPFKGDFSITAHPVFELQQHCKKKGHLVTFNKNKPHSDLVDETTRKTAIDSNDRILQIPEGEEIDIIIDEDFIAPLRVRFNN